MSSPTSENPAPQYVSDRDLAGRYGVSVTSIWRWSRTGRIPVPVKIGVNATRWNLAEVQAALAKAALEEAGTRSPGWIAAKAAVARKGGVR